MFDIGFLELVIIAVVGLLVIGPERLPEVARTVGKWIGGARRLMNSVQAEINAEVNKADELKRLLEEQAEIKSVHEILETDISGEDERKPVPRAKPDYLVKAVSDEVKDPVEAETSAENQSKQNESNAGQ
ncbi:Sec-independent protein translocase protein TatB [Kaarinaea lacus]